MILKKIDSVGRIVIPSEIRTSLHWKANDEIELTIKDDSLMLKKKIHDCPKCLICGSYDNIAKLPFEENMYICENCEYSIKEM